MQVFVEIPYVLVQAFVYAVIVYSMMSFHWTVAKFTWFFFITFSSFLNFTYFGMMTVSFSPNHQIAAIIAAFFYALFNLFSGFFIPKPVSSLFHSDTSLSSFYLHKPTNDYGNCWFIQRVGFCRKFHCGGYGTTGFARCHGRCMG